MTEAEHEAMLDAEIVCAVREVTHDATGGNCAFADSDVKLLGRLASLAIKAGLHNELTDLSLQTRRNMDCRYGLGVYAQVDRSPEGQDAKRLDRNDESAVAKPCAPKSPC